MRTVYATVLEVQNKEEIDVTLTTVSRWIHNWYKRQRINVDISGSLVDEDLVSHPADGHQIVLKHFEAASFPKCSVIDIHWSYPDQYDRSLGWHVHLSLYRTSVGLTLSIELSVTGRQLLFSPASFKLGSPRLIRDIARLGSVTIGGYSYSSTPDMVGAEDVPGLVEELVNPKRVIPILVVARRTGDDRPLLDTSQVSDQVAGVAKVYELADKWSAFRLTEMLTKPLSCFGGAIRVYWPRFTTESDPYLHPLWMPWQLKDEGGAAATLAEITRRLFEAAAFRHVEPQTIGLLRSSADRERREAARAQGSSSAEQLLEDLVKLEQEYASLQTEHADLLVETETLRLNAMALSSHASSCQVKSVSYLTDAPSEWELPHEQGDEGEPRTMREAVEIAASKCRSISFLETAFQSAETSPYRHPERALEALLAIDEVAATWAASLGASKSIGSVRDLFSARGFEYKADISQTSRGKWGSEYSATVEGRELDIAPHITIGAKQADKCLSVHWAWDEVQRKAVVAHVGRHKTNTRT